jgi:hypothetical protein
VIRALTLACATCIASPFGDRTYNWPYLMLILLPFVVAAVIGGVLAHMNGTFRLGGSGRPPSPPLRARSESEPSATGATGATARQEETT